MPFIAVIGKLELEGVIAGDFDQASEEDPNYYENFISILIYVNKDLTYNFDSKNLLDAVDVLFKIFIVLKIDFAPECGNIWSFFKEYIYGIDSNCCTKYSTVSQFVKKNLLKKLKDLEEDFEEPMHVDESDNEWLFSSLYCAWGTVSF